MSFLKNGWLIAAVLIAVLWGAENIWWENKYPSVTLHYKMTVNVDTPEGVKTGSTVREIYAYSGPKILPEAPSGHAQVKGEAVVIDLGKRGVLFVLMRRESGYDEDYGASLIFALFGGGTSPDGIRSIKSLKNAKVILTPEQYPLMATFHDMKDHKTFAIVFETEPYDAHGPGGLERRFQIRTDNFEKFFGQGVKIKDISVEISEEPVTKIVDKFLPTFGPGIEGYFKSWFY